MRIGLISGKSSKTLTLELKRRGFEVILLCGKSSDPGFNDANQSLELFFTLKNTQSNIKIAVNYFLENKISALILGTGTWFAFEIAEVLEKKGIPTSHNLQISKVFKDKFLTKKLFERYGLNTPEYIFKNKIKKEDIIEMKFPSVIKSNIDLFPVFLCKDEIRGLKFIEETDNDIIKKGVLFEKYYQGNDITIPVMATKNNSKGLGVIYWSKQMNYRLEGFDALQKIKLNTEDENSLINMCENFLLKTGYYGLCRFDIRLTKQDKFFLEVNSVISIRNDGTSYQSMINKDINLEKIAIDTYLKNIYGNI
jgi:carbamoylphosphate synthase large subunit